MTVLRTIASLWWARIACTLFVVIAGAAVLALPPVSPTIQSALMLLLAIALLLGFERLRGSLHTSGLSWHTNTGLLLRVGLLLGAGMVTVILFLAYVSKMRFEWAAAILPASVLISIVAVILNSALEEVLFRGTIFEALQERFGAALAVISTSILFGIAHILNPSATALSVLNTILAGVLLGALVIQSQSLYPAIAFHAAWNVLVGMFVGNVSGMDLGVGLIHINPSSDTSRWLFGDGYGVEEGALASGLLVLGIVIVLKYLPLDVETRAARYRRNFSGITNSAT